MPKLEDRFAKAAELWSKGKFKEAMAIYRRLLQNETISKMARAILCEYIGRLHVGLGDLKTAEDFLRRAVSLDSENVDHHVQLANCLCLCDRREEAWQLVRQLYQRASHHPAVLHYMGKMLDERGQHARGLAFMKKAIHLDPHNARLLADLAFSYLMRGNAGAAMVCSEQALALHSEDEVVQFVHELASTYERQSSSIKPSPSQNVLPSQDRKKSQTKNLKREAK